MDIGTANWVQHLTPRAGEVLILPFESARYLIQNRPNQWQPLIIVPNIVPTGIDGPTGLDTIDVAVSTVWGITQDGVLYWDDTGVDGADVATVTYSSGFATFDGGYGQAIARPMLRRGAQLKRVWWKKSGYEQVNVTVELSHDGTAHKYIDAPKNDIRSIESISRLSISSHPNIALSWQSYGEGTMLKIEGATSTVHPDPPLSVVITYWRKSA